MQNILPKYSNSKENQIFNKSKILYNLNNVVKMQNIDSLYIVEGFMDTIAFYRIGVLNVVATMGVNLSPFHIKTIISLESIKKIILCFDNDNAGKLATFTNGISLLKNGFEVYVVNNFKDSKDIDELLNKKNINDAKIAVEDISDFITYFINLKINEKKVEKNVIEEIIKVMIETNDILLKNNHLQLISEKTNIPFEDIKSFFNNIAKNDDDFLNYDVNEIDDSNNKHNDKDNSKINDDNLKNIESINNKKLNLFEIGCKKILADFLFNAINFPELIQIFFNKIGFFMPQKYFPEYYNIFKLLLSYTNNAKKPYSLEDFLNYVEEKNGQEYASEIKIFINSNPRMNLKNEYLESGIKNIALLEKKMNEYKISELLEKIKKENDQNKTKDYFEQIKKIKEENKK
jgi:DNA primase